MKGSTPGASALLMIALVGGFYLLHEHRNPVSGNWIYLMLLACPLMYLFPGQVGHGDHATPLTQPNDKEV